VERDAASGQIHDRRLQSYRRLLGLARGFDTERRNSGPASRRRPVRK
jgi:hypothetical protein